MEERKKEKERSNDWRELESQKMDLDFPHSFRKQTRAELTFFDF